VASQEVFKCPICNLEAAVIFARDNPFIIFKCPKCGFVYYDKMSGEAVKGTIKGEKPYGSICMEGVFVSEDGKIREHYYRTLNAPYGGSILDFLLAMIEETLKEEQKHG
jgi:transposase-like protein